MAPTKRKRRRKTYGKKKSKSDLIRDYMRYIYTSTDKGGSFSGPEAMYQEIKRRKTHDISRSQIKNFLQSMDSYTLTRTIKATTHTAKIVVPETEWQIECDTLDLVGYSPKDNDNIRFLVCGIDAFSRKGAVATIPNKESQHIVTALDAIFKQLGKPVTLRTDRGSEYKNQRVRAHLKTLGVHHYFANSMSKASICERWHRTIRASISRYLEYKNTKRFIHVLQDLITAYNFTPSRPLGYKRPVDIQSPQSQVELYERLYLQPKPIKKKFFRFKINDRVRLTMIKNTFEKEGSGREYNFTLETFSVYKRIRRNNVNMYKVMDCRQEILEGSIYENDMQLVTETPNTKYKVENVIGEEVKDGEKFLKVTLKGYPKECTELVRSRDVIKI